MKDEKREYEGVIRYIDGYSWGIAASGETICLGSEDAVKVALANPKLKSGYQDIDQVIELERNLMKEYEVSNGESGNVKTESSRGKRAIRTSNFRTGPIVNVKYQPVNTGHLKARKKLSSGEVITTTPGVSDKSGRGLVETTARLI